MKRLFLYTIAAGLLLSTFSCERPRQATVSNEISIEVDSLHWTYFSIETGMVVGHSTFGSAQEDAVWAARLDWDMAVCREYIRTNSGTSGQGKGGILRDQTSDFIHLIQAPTEGYITDKNDIVVKD